MATPEIQQVSQDLSQLARTLKDVVASSSQVASAQSEQARSIRDEGLLTIERQAKDRKLNKEQQTLYEKALAAKREEIRLQKEANDLTAKSAAVHKDYSKTEGERTAASKAAVDAHSKLTTAQQTSVDASSKFTQSLGGLTKGTNLASAALVWFGSTLKTAINQAKLQVVANQGMVEGTGSLVSALATQQDLALKYGMSGSDFAAVTSANRQMINAMGGTNNAIAQIGTSMDSFYTMTGSNAAAFQALTETMTSFAQKGVSPTQKVLEAYTTDVKQLAMQTGMNQQQAREYFDQVGSDIESMDILRSARKDERESILANQRAMVTNAIAQGMSTEAAKEAVKTLNKMAAAKPIDRLKQAAKIRALGGAMGIEGAEEAAQAVTAGKRQTPEQAQALMQFSQNAANTMDQAGQGSLGGEIFATSLMDKLDLSQYYGKGSNFSTTMGDTLAAPLTDLKKTYIDTSKTAEAQAYRQFDLLMDQKNLILSGNNYLGVIAAGVAAIGAMMLSGKIGSIAGNLATKAGAVLKGAGGAGVAAAEAAGASAGAATTAGKSAGILSKLGGAATSVGKVAAPLGAALDVGLGAADLVNGKRQTDMPQGWDVISPMRWGMYGGEKINQGAESLMGGQSIGSKIYDWMNPDTSAAQPKNMGSDKPTVVSEQIKTTTKATEEIKTATVNSADSLQMQVKQMDTSNDMLKRLTDLTEKQVTLAEKQLVASTLTQAEKDSGKGKTSLRADNKFASQYNYV